MMVELGVLNKHITVVEIDNGMTNDDTMMDDSPSIEEYCRPPFENIE
jgi:hypothetical protein